MGRSIGDDGTGLTHGSVAKLKDGDGSALRIDPFQFGYWTRAVNGFGFESVQRWALVSLCSL